MSTVDLSLETDDDIKIEHGRMRSTVSITAEIDEVLSHFTAEEVCGYFTTSELLDAIGKDAAAEHFDLTQAV